MCGVAYVSVKTPQYAEMIKNHQEQQVLSKTAVVDGLIVLSALRTDGHRSVQYNGRVFSSS